MAHLRDLIVNGNSRTFGTAYATKFEGPLTGNATSATKATQDGNGNVITSTYATASSLSSHTGNKSNPHGVTKAQVGLGSVVNIDQSKAIKSITRSGTTFTATALDGSTTTFTQQDNNTTYGIATSTTPGLIKSGGDVTVDASTGTISINDNSHSHSISNISGLQSALDSKLNTSLKGSKNGLATLDSNGFVPSSQLPSYVDDVIDVSMKSDLTSATNASGTTITPETGKIYIDDIGTSATNKTYRWSGTTYVVISETLALGETTSTAFDGARGKVAYNHSQSAHARVDATNTKASTTNGHISINGTDTTVYTHPGYTAHASGLYKVTVDGQGHVSSATAVTKSDITGLGIPGQDTNTTYSVATSTTPGLVKSGGNVTVNTDGTMSVAYASSAGSANAVAWANVSGKPSTYYTHPSYTSHAAGLYKVTVDGSGHVSAATAVTKADITALGIPGQDTNTTYTDATTSAHGLMTAAMVSKLNGIASGANAYVHPSYTAHGTGLYKVSVDGSGHVSGVTAVTKADITALGIPGQDTNTTYTLAGLGGVAKSGDTMSGNLSFSDIGDKATSAGIVWNGSTDGAKIYYKTSEANRGHLVLQANDDGNETIDFEWITGSTIATKSYISSDGVYHGTATYANSAGSANSVAWGNISGKPSTYTPSTHTHTIAQVTNLQSSLDAKINRSGDTMKGALNFANGTKNVVGDDVAIGDFNQGGSLGIQGLNGTTTVSLLAQGGSWDQSAAHMDMVYNTTDQCCDFKFK